MQANIDPHFKVNTVSIIEGLNVSIDKIKYTEIYMQTINKANY